MMEKLTPAQAWERYVGDQTVAEFLRESGLPADLAVDAYVSHGWPFGEPAPGDAYDLLLQYITEDALHRA